MKTISRFIVGFWLFSPMLPTQAGQPLFSLSPLSATTINMPNNISTTVQYQVTNNTKITRTLTMKPITGATQNIDKPYCSNPFTLLAHEFCTLTLTFSGPALAAAPIPSVIGGPVVCKTLGNGNNSPDTTLCSQPSEANSLHITLSGEIENATIVALNDTLELSTDGQYKKMVIENLSTDVPATGIVPDFTGTQLDGNIGGMPMNCATVAPNGQCTIIYTPLKNFVGPTSFPIKGQNTNTIMGNITIYLGSISGCNSLVGSGSKPYISCTGAIPTNNYIANNAQMELVGSDAPCATNSFSGNPPVISIVTVTSSKADSAPGVAGKSFVGCKVRLCNNAQCDQYSNTVLVKQ